MITIYKILCHFSGDVKYIGKTKHPLRKRLSSHFSYSSVGMNKWLKKFKAYSYKGNKPTIEEVETVPEEISKEIELKWIKHYESIGEPLLNIQGTYKMSLPRGKAFKQNDRRLKKQPEKQ